MLFSFLIFHVSATDLTPLTPEMARHVTPEMYEQSPDLQYRFGAMLLRSPDPQPHRLALSIIFKLATKQPPHPAAFAESMRLVLEDPLLQPRTHILLEHAQQISRRVIDEYLASTRENDQKKQLEQSLLAAHKETSDYFGEQCRNDTNLGDFGPMVAFALTYLTGVAITKNMRDLGINVPTTERRETRSENDSSPLIAREQYSKTTAARPARATAVRPTQVTSTIGYGSLGQMGNEKKEEDCCCCVIA